jgi:hypothetical protein
MMVKLAMAIHSELSAKDDKIKTLSIHLVLQGLSTSFHHS